MFKVLPKDSWCLVDTLDEAGYTTVCDWSLNDSMCFGRGSTPIPPPGKIMGSPLSPSEERLAEAHQQSGFGPRSTSLLSQVSPARVEKPEGKS